MPAPASAEPASSATKATPEATRFIAYSSTYAEECSRLREARKAEMPETTPMTPTAKATKVIGARRNIYGDKTMSAQGLKNATPK